MSTVAEAEQVVKKLVEGGATAIKVSLEPGGEDGAPWMMPHGENPVPATPWPMLPEPVVKAIVSKAHALKKRVIAHVSENTGFKRAVDAGVDELAHMPCSAIDDGLLKTAVDKGIRFVTTIDTLSSCGMGLHGNAMKLAGKGAKFIYGSEIAHDNVPWGINGEEMHMILHLTSGATTDFQDVVNVFKAVTSEAGKRLGVNPLLGQLVPGAPADIIAVRGNPFERFKILEYPALVMSGGQIVVNKFAKK
ncbi:Amidohydrolase (fragment) [Crenothrix polyspora]|uniref:Amidohydrolase n=1 Tax=Crenothrix polyspora TaxID=360316 RepID=A0A1R4H1G2_9GAMM